MTKQEAAEFLGVSLRALERYTAQNRVAVRYEKGKTRSVLVYEESELERFKAEVERERHRPTIERAGDEPARFDPNPAKIANSVTSMAAFGDIPPEAILGALVHLMQLASRSAPALDGTPTGEASSTSSSRSPSVPTADKTLLSLEEAGAITGLSRLFLKEAVVNERLAARKIGRAWRIKRRDLDRFVDAL